MNEILVKSGVEIDLGKRGEHLARCIVFDISGWQKTYGDGSVHLLHQRNGDKAPYPCVVETDGTFVRWLLSETDVDVAGRGRAELQYFVDEARVKSETWNTRTNRSMNNEGPIPEEPAENWLNTMLQLGTETQENAEIAEQSAEIAKQSAEMAKNSEEYVAGVVADVVAEALDEIQTSVETATESAEIAKTSSAEAQESAEAAEANALAASEAEQAAKDAQAAAEQARDEAQELAGGDFATKSEAQGYANTAEANANRYTDQALSQIPAPDVSGQINAHNTDTGAHGDIRERINALTAADVGARPNTWMPTAADVGALPALRSEYLNCFYYMVGDEKEWINPPMLPGVEYRTTKRFGNNISVYTKRIDVGWVSANADNAVAHESLAPMPVSIEMYNNYQEVITHHQAITNLRLDQTNIYYKSSNDLGNASFVIEYCKERIF